MKSYRKLSKEELTALKNELEHQYVDAKGKGLQLNMARGKPSVAQLDMTMDIMDTFNSNSILKTEAGDDCRNYGVMEGIPEARKLMGDLMGVASENVIVCGNASLSIMYDTVSRSMTHGVLGSTPWCKLEKVKFLCPVPGYDRHFAITEHFGIEMINIPMSESGPDMDMVEELVNKDASVKGIWCVPKYSNPTGTVYSDEVVSRFATLKPKAQDFRIFWDNAYCVHSLTESPAQIMDIISACEQAGNPNMVYEFCSTSKITFPGAGISGVATSAENLADIKNFMKHGTIGFDKLNQLRHARFFSNGYSVSEHMQKHAAILNKKFNAVYDSLEKNLGECNIAEWTHPEGGYFISFDTVAGCASKAVTKCGEAGVKFTPAGATFPYKIDPEDRNIRLAPTYADLNDIEPAVDLLCLCVKIASLEKLLSK